MVRSQVADSKNMFKMNKNEADKRKSACHSLATNQLDTNPDFQTSNQFFHIMTQHSLDTQKTNEVVNENLAGIDPTAFEMQAKKSDQIWLRGTYKDPESQVELMKTTDRSDLVQ